MPSLTLLLVALSAVPPQGVPLQVRHGFFFETDLGAFTTVGGQDHYSNAETYLQLGVGYDLMEHLEVGASFGLGTSAANCFTQRDAEGVCSLADSFTMSFFDLSAAYLLPLKGRLFLRPRVIAGYADLDPAPRVDDNGKSLRHGADLGAAIGVEYATAMDHFSIGADLAFRYVLGPRIASFALFPRIKYTF